MFPARSLWKCSAMLVCLLLASCAAQTAAPTPPPLAMPTGPGDEWQLVVIGDSSLWGLGEAYASQIEKDLGVKVVLDDYTLPSLRASSVLEVLLTGKSANSRLEKLPEALKGAEVVVLFTNPLGSVDPNKPMNLDGCFGCSTPQACTSEGFEKFTADLSAIWAKIIELRAGQPTILRATDIYNPLVAEWKRCDIFTACDACWGNMSKAARKAAETYNIPFLSRYDAFDGRDHSEDPREKGYIRDDGEHPNEAASQFTAELLSKMGYDPVALP